MTNTAKPDIAAAAASEPTSPPVCWINGRLTPLAEARISVFDHGLLYGDGVFEGIRFYNGRPFRLARHLARLQASARVIRLNIPCSRGALDLAIQDSVAAYARPTGYVRLVVTRGEGRLGIDPASCVRPNVIVIVDELTLVPPAVRRDGARVVIASTRRLPADGLDARVKSLNYLNHVLARMEASHAGADEAILLNAAGHVTEGSADNVFIVRDGVLRTPPVSDGALEGVTREVVIELAAELGLTVRLESLTPYDLYTADECFLTGTGAELIPVREIDGRALRACPGPVYLQLNATFRVLVDRETTPHWSNGEIDA